MKKTFVWIVGGGLLLTGCSSQPQPAPTVTVTVPQASDPTPTTTPVPEGPLALGESADEGAFTVTAHAVNLDSVPPPAPQPENTTDKWASADVEFCSVTVDSFVISDRWALIDESNHRFRPSNTGYSQFPEPAYAWGEVPISPGECIRGWITFVVNKDATVTSLRYDNTQGTRVDWAVS